MKRVVYSALVLFSVMLVSACSSYNYYKAGTTALSTSKYKSFAWLPDAEQKAPKPRVNGKTYAGNAYYNNPEAVRRIKDATFMALQTKGLRLETSTPDLLVHYTSVVGRGTRMEYYSPYYGYGFGPGFGIGYGWGGGFRGGWGWGGGFGWGWPYAGFGGYGGYGYGGGYAYPEHYKEGTIIIDLIDRKTNKIVWRGFGVGELHRNAQKTIDDLPKVVDGIFKQLPVTL